jgi:hypothetical protein
VGAGITVWRALIGPLAVIALIFAVPPTALSLLLAMDFTPPPALPANANAEQALEHQFASSPELVALRTLIERFGPAGIALVVVAALVIVSWLALNWLLTYRLLAARLIGNTQPVSAIVRGALARFPVFAASVLLALIGMGGLMALTMVIASGVAAVSGPLGALAGFLGFGVLLWAACPLLLVWPIAAAEPAGPGESLVRALTLAREHRLYIATVAFLTLLVALGAGAVEQLVGAAIPANIAWLRLILSLGIGVLISPLLCAIIAALYVDLWYRDAAQPAADRRARDDA